MLIYSKASAASIANAVKKAKQVKPRVKVIGFGKFEVASTSGAAYQVSFTKNADGDLVVLCGCTSNSKSNRACYHAAAVSSLFKQQVADRAAAKIATACQDCGNQAYVFEGATVRCLPCASALAASAELFS